MKQILFAAVLMGLVGCASSNALRLASNAENICKHCNCYMPSGIAQEAECPVCNCGYRAFQCNRLK